MYLKSVVLCLLSGLLLGQAVYSPEEYAADSVAGHAQLIASTIGDSDYQLWNVKYCRSALVKWLCTQCARVVNINIIDRNTHKIVHRTRFAVTYDGNNRDYWRNLDPLRQDLLLFCLQHQTEIKRSQYRVSILVAFTKTHQPQPGWCPAGPNYPRLDIRARQRVQSTTVLRVGGISIDATTTGLVIGVSP